MHACTAKIKNAPALQDTRLRGDDYYLTYYGLFVVVVRYYNLSFECQPGGKQILGFY